jgi:uncharacterized protein YkwD
MILPWWWMNFICFLLRDKLIILYYYKLSMKKLLFWIIIISLITITHADYKTIVTTVLNDIQTTNNNKTDLQKRQNFQNYIPKIQKLTIVDQRVRDALITYLNAKIAEIDEWKINTNKWLLEFSKIDPQKIRDTRLQRHNEERRNLWLHEFTYDLQLEQTATNRAQYLAKIDKSTHSRLSTDWYYNYNSIKSRFENFWITFPREKNWLANFHENIALRRNYSCNKTDCTDYTIKRIKDWFNFFMAEKYKDYKAHYDAIIASHTKKMWVGIAISSSNKIFIVTHYSVDF